MFLNNSSGVKIILRRSRKQNFKDLKLQKFKYFILLNQKARSEYFDTITLKKHRLNKYYSY